MLTPMVAHGRCAVWVVPPRAQQVMVGPTIFRSAILCGGSELLRHRVHNAIGPTTAELGKHR